MDQEKGNPIHALLVENFVDVAEGEFLDLLGVVCDHFDAHLCQVRAAVENKLSKIRRRDQHLPQPIIAESQYERSRSDGLRLDDDVPDERAAGEPKGDQLRADGGGDEM